METESTTSSTVASKAPLWIGLAVAAALVFGYLGMCGVAQASPTIISAITIADVAVGGMSKTEATQAVSSALSKQLEQTSITYSGSSWNGILEGDIVMAQVDLAVDLAYGMGRDNFLTSGFYYLTGKTTGDGNISISLSLNDSGKLQLSTLLDEADASLNGAVVQSVWSVYPDTGELWVTKGISGVAVNREAAETATLTALSNSTGTGANVTLSTDSTPPLSLDFSGIQNEIYTEAVSAEINVNTLEISQHVLGVDLDTQVAQSLYQQAAEGETFAIPLHITEPEQTKEALAASLFADELASVSSRTTGTAARISNVTLAAEFCNNTILMPGETFSYYEQCAPYSLSNGYGVATAYVAGQTVDEVAGGICQVSSTIYYAVLHTNLEVVERRGHQFTVDYLPAGLDATVYSTVTDFKFKNTSEYPIKITSEVNTRNGVRYTDVVIYGTKTDDITIEPVSNAYNYVTLPTQYVADPEVAQGSSKTVQTSYTGCTATVTRYFYDANGALLKEELVSTNRYNSRAAIIHYNPADAAKYGQAVDESYVTEEAPSTDTGLDFSEIPSTDTPSTDTPSTDSPSTDSPSTDSPSIETPNTEEAVTPEIPAEEVEASPSVPEAEAVPSPVEPEPTIPEISTGNESASSIPGL